MNSKVLKLATAMEGKRHLQTKLGKLLFMAAPHDQERMERHGKKRQNEYNLNRAICFKLLSSPLLGAGERSSKRRNNPKPTKQ